MAWRGRIETMTYARDFAMRECAKLVSIMVHIHGLHE